MYFLEDRENLNEPYFTDESRELLISSNIRLFFEHLHFKHNSRGVRIRDEIMYVIKLNLRTHKISSYLIAGLLCWFWTCWVEFI